MKKLILSFGLCLVGASLFAVNVRGARELLWPAGKMPNAQAHQVAKMTDDDGLKEPFLEWYEAPSNATDVCVVLISGGGYQSTCDCNLVDYWHRKFAALGVHTVNLVYRTPRPVGLPIYQSAWEDGQRAIRLVRSQAAKRGYNPEKIGTISMSAGSHLATLLATSALTPAYTNQLDAIDQVPCHLNFAITCAIAYALTDGIGVPNTREGQSLDAVLDKCFKFDAKTAPMCMFHGGIDLYSPNASTRVYRRLRELKIPAELHLFADRNHGFFGWNEGQANSTGYDNWFGRAEEFLRQHGILPVLGAEQDLLDRFGSDADRGEYKKEFLWPEGKMPDRQAHQCVPYLEWHFPKVKKTEAIQIIYSGGGYGGNSPEGHEVAPVRRYLNAKGMTVVTMKYRTPRPHGLPKHITAWQDLQRAIRVVRAQAKDLGLDPNRIGIMGSSAGGHLTLMGVTSSNRRAYWGIDEFDKLPCNANWAIAIYPAYALTDGLDVENQTGGNADSAVLAPEFTFDPNTCPTLFIHGDSDGWAAMNSVKAWEKMRAMGVQSELHTLCHRRHCFQFKAAPGTGSYTWMDRIWEFMNAKGYNR